MKVYLATILKMGCVTDVFLGTWPKSTEQQFRRTFCDACGTNASGARSWWCSLTF